MVKVSNWLAVLLGTASAAMDPATGTEWLDVQDAMMERWNERLYKRDEQAVRAAEFSGGLLAPGWGFTEAPGVPAATENWSACGTMHFKPRALSTARRLAFSQTCRKRGIALFEESSRYSAPGESSIV